MHFHFSKASPCAILLAVKIRWKILLTLGAVTFAVWLAYTVRPSGEPRYNGKPLSFWAQQFGAAPDHYNQGVFKEAVTHIGTNAIPFFLQWVEYEPASWRTNIGERYIRLTGKPTPDLVIGEEWDKAIAVPTGFRALGEQAAWAVPALCQIIGRAGGTNANTIANAMYSLAGIGADALPFLQTFLTNQNPTLRRAAANALRIMGKNAKPAVPGLRAALGDQDTKVQFEARRALKEIAPELLTNSPAAK